MTAAASTNATETAERVECRRCHRPLRSEASRAARIGGRCAAIEAATEGLSAKQIEKLDQVIVDKGVKATNRKGVYKVANQDGSVIRTAHLDGTCDCEWGSRRSADTKVCYHVAAARLTAKPVIYRSRKRLAAPAPAAVPASATTPGDIWAEIERLNDAFMAVA